MANPVFISVVRSTFDMMLVTTHSKRGSRDVIAKERNFQVTVGKVGANTKAGRYRVVAKTTTPDWRIPPNVDYDPNIWGLIVPFWVPDYEKLALPEPIAEGFLPLGVRNIPLLDESGNTIPNPKNPFESGFISFEDKDPKNDNEGQGFHDLKADEQVGTRSSHGCIRMHTEDLKSVYDKIPIGALVAIS